MHDTITLKMAARNFLPRCIAFFNRTPIELLRFVIRTSGGVTGGYEGGKYAPTFENLSKIVIEKCNRNV